ncbi:MAG: hypothetical protein MZV63_58560 [Marinilabiliales bacterium]|nr:hypothetical protein [Marinilabiliales bacterium]
MTFESGGRGLLGEQGVFQDSTNVFQDDKTTGLNSLKRLTDITGGRYYAQHQHVRAEPRAGPDADRHLLRAGLFRRTRQRGRPVPRGQGGRSRGRAARSGPSPATSIPSRSPRCPKMEKELHLYDLALNERSLSRMPENVPDGRAGLRLRRRPGPARSWPGCRPRSRAS